GEEVRLLAPTLDLRPDSPHPFPESPVQIPRSVVVKSAGSALAVVSVVLAVFVNIEQDPEYSAAKFQGEVLVANSTSAAAAGSAPAKRFQISGKVVDLFPGAQATLTLRFDNPLNQDIRVTSARVQVVSTNKPGCSTTSVTATDYLATGQDSGVLVRRKSSASHSLPIAMGSDAEHACSGAVFSLAYSGTAVQA
ncbi:MAG: hypothetical protein M3394_00510, partial [Actinomycetota bacterium]|nr:hypothetical protein [Actinomycetota bacterium]